MLDKQLLVNQPMASIPRGGGRGYVFKSRTWDMVFIYQLGMLRTGEETDSQNVCIKFVVGNRLVDNDCIVKITKLANTISFGVTYCQWDGASSIPRRNSISTVANYHHPSSPYVVSAWETWVGFGFEDLEQEELRKQCSATRMWRLEEGYPLRG
ncbi:hypothetical protein BDQ17DRAFT_1325977 [Cyathus striatus]|nr:hypothetical protein BDQ17DRAFT_1325977 [Cyathus striatus]